MKLYQKIPKHDKYQYFWRKYNWSVMYFVCLNSHYLYLFKWIQIHRDKYVDYKSVAITVKTKKKVTQCFCYYLNKNTTIAVCKCFAQQILFKI